jgi:hypothetical protein
MLTREEDKTAHSKYFNLNRRASTACSVKHDKYGKVSYGHAHQMCFGGLAALITKHSEYIINGIQYMWPNYESSSKENTEFFLDYLMNESPFKDCFFDKDVKWSIENNLTFHKIDMPGNMVIGCLSAVREMWEEYSSQGFKYFKQLVDAGCTKDFAWLIIHNLKYGVDTDLCFKRPNYNGGHSAWPENSANIGDAINYINCNIPGVHENNFWYGYPYKGVFQLFLNSYDVVKGDDNFAYWIINNSDKKVKSNVRKEPWESGAAIVYNITLPVNEMIEEMALMCDKFYKTFKEYIK